MSSTHKAVDWRDDCQPNKKFLESLLRREQLSRWLLHSWARVQTQVETEKTKQCLLSGSALIKNFKSFSSSFSWGLAHALGI